MGNNFKVFQAETLIDQAITDISVGEAYYILRAKMLQIQKLYYQRVNEEYAAAQVKESPSQDQDGDERAPAEEETSQGKNN